MADGGGADADPFTRMLDPFAELREFVAIGGHLSDGLAGVLVDKVKPETRLVGQTVEEGRSLDVTSFHPLQRVRVERPRCVERHDDAMIAVVVVFGCGIGGCCLRVWRRREVVFGCGIGR